MPRAVQRFRLPPRYGLPDRCLQLVWLESERPGLTLIGYQATGVDQVKAIGPSGVCGLGRVPKFIEDRWNLDSKLADARARNESAFVFIARAGENHFVFDVAFHLPDVARMGLGDIDHQKRHLASVLLIKLVEGGHLPPERRSGVTAEHENHRLALRGQGR